MVTRPRRHLTDSRAVQHAVSLESAGSFLVGEVRNMTRGRWVAVWRVLYPAHQKVAPLNRFVTCERAAPASASLQSIRVTSVVATAVRVAGSSRPVDGAAVTVHVELSWDGPRDPVVLDHTFHVVPSDGHWTWVLSETGYQAFRGGGCAA